MHRPHIQISYPGISSILEDGRINPKADMNGEACLVVFLQYRDASIRCCLCFAQLTETIAEAGSDLLALGVRHPCRPDGVTKRFMNLGYKYFCGLFHYSAAVSLL